MATKKHTAPPQGALTGGIGGPSLGLGSSAGGSLLSPGASTLGGGAQLVPPPMEDQGPLVESLADMAGDATYEETSAEMMERARAILVNKEQREGQRVAVELANDTEFWFAVYFQSREQKEAYLRAIGYGGPKDPDKYIDGQRLAAKQCIALPARPAPYKVGKLDKKLKDMT